jgi:hypothetical protein
MLRYIRQVQRIGDVAGRCDRLMREGKTGARVLEAASVDFEQADEEPGCR